MSPFGRHGVVFIWRDRMKYLLNRICALMRAPPRGGRCLRWLGASPGVTTIEYGLIIATISLVLASAFRSFQERFMAIVLSAGF